MSKLLSVILTTAFLLSCSNDVSLQRYFVDHLETKNFISQDFPLSMIALDQTNFSEDQKEAYHSVEKLNILGYKIDETNASMLSVESEKVKTILSDVKYNDLMEFSDKGNKIHVKYIGTDDKADEVIIFGIAKEKGFGIVRILGNDMQPDKMVTLLSVLQNASIDENQFKDIMNFFK